jgi:hypothetical protein
MTKRKEGSTSKPRKPWTPEEDAIITLHVPEIGAKKLETLGLMPGRRSGNIRSRWRQLSGMRNFPQRSRKSAGMALDPKFSRQHVSVWGYAQSVGASA